ncbi:MAG: DHA2 family efflux MFS transporter permease subunit [Nitrospirota bacterium]
MDNKRPQVNKWLVTISVMLPTVMEIIDTSVANVALPHMAGSLSASADEITWVLTSYLVSNAVVLPMTGWLGGVFGRKRFLISCIVLFTVASLFCGAAPTLGLLIFFRVLQGAAGGALQPMSQAILFETFPPEEQGIAMAIFGIGAMFGPIIGPALGGWITDNISWRWIFYINIPTGVIAVIMVKYFIFDPGYIKKKFIKMDYIGLGLLVTGLGALQVVLDKGQREDWFSSSFIVFFAIVAVISLALLIFVELRQKQPIVNLRLFKNSSFASGNVLMFMFGFCLYSTIVLLPLMLQTLMGYDATLAGLVLAPGGVATLMMMPLVGIALSRYDGRYIILTGLITGSIALFLMSRFNLQASYWTFVWPRVVLGIGLAMVFVPLTTLTFSTIPKEQMGNATGFFNLLRNIGGSVGIGVSATLLQRFSQFYQNTLVGHVNPYSLVLQSRLNGLTQVLESRGVNPVTARKSALAAIYQEVQRQAGMLSYNRIFLILCVAFMLVSPLLILLKRGRGKGPAGVH